MQQQGKHERIWRITIFVLLLAIFAFVGEGLVWLRQRNDGNGRSTPSKIVNLFGK